MSLSNFLFVIDGIVISIWEFRLTKKLLFIIQVTVWGCQL
jgi:hypothetical protein